MSKTALNVIYTNKLCQQHKLLYRSKTYLTYVLCLYGQKHSSTPHLKTGWFLD